MTILIIGAVFTESCSENNAEEMPADVVEVLNLAGKNKGDLTQVINYFKDDSLKLQAALFLIGSMKRKGFYKYDLIDRSGKIYHHDYFTVPYPDVLHRKIQYDSSIDKELFYVNRGFQYDYNSITSDNLVENIEYAFKAWHLPWATHLNFAEFCEYILPYRMNEEPLQNWRKEKYESNIHWVTAKMKTSTNLLQLCNIINDSLKRKYLYLHKEMAFYPGTLTVGQANAFNGGRCEDLNMVAAYDMRAVGIPIATEFTPYWANSNYGGHSWLSILNNHRYVPFNAAYDNPSLDSLPFGGAHLAKAFRRNFGFRPESKMKMDYDLSVPSLFTDPQIQDVTSEYLPVSDVEIHFQNEFPEDKIVYLAVLNGKYWKAVQFAKIRNSSAIFKSMSRNTLYAPIITLTSSPQMAGDAFLLSEKGALQNLETDTLQKKSLNLKTKRINWLSEGEPCKIVYWNKVKWTFVGNSKHFSRKKEDIMFENIPSNTIYRIINDSTANKIEGNFGRPFLFNKETKQIMDY